MENLHFGDSAFWRFCYLEIWRFPSFIETPASRSLSWRGLERRTSLIDRYNIISGQLPTSKTDNLCIVVCETSPKPFEENALRCMSYLVFRHRRPSIVSESHYNFSNGPCIPRWPVPFPEGICLRPSSWRRASPPSTGDRSTPCG